MKKLTRHFFLLIMIGWTVACTPAAQLTTATPIPPSPIVIPTHPSRPTNTPTTIPTATATATPTVEAPTPTTAEVTATPTATFTPTAPPGPTELSWVVSGFIVTVMYRDETGNIYFAASKNMQGISDPYQAEAAVWKKPVDGQPIQLTPWTYNLIGGIVVHNRFIYFNEAGNLRRMPDDNQVHNAEVVLHFPKLSKIYMHINHALAKYTLNGQEVLLMAVGTMIDSNYDAPQHHSGIFPPYYEDFPTGRILYAPLSWLETTTNYEVKREVPGEVSEFARGFRNPWSITVANLDGQIHVFAADNDPTFTPEKYDSDPQNAGDELTEVFFGRHHGHPYYYAGREPEPDYVPPLVVFPDGSVPSGVAVAAGKIFVALQNSAMIVKADIENHTWTPVLTQINPFNLYGYGDLLYIVDWAGIRVVDARSL